MEGTGFEPSVPLQEKWSMPSSSDQTRVGRTLIFGGGTPVFLEGRDIELSVSSNDIRTSPLGSTTISGGETDGSNPPPSSGESVANLILGTHLARNPEMLTAGFTDVALFAGSVGATRCQSPDLDNPVLHTA
jgi:hypothetical protein